MGAVTIDNSKTKEMSYDMETGEMKEKAPALN